MKVYKLIIGLIVFLPILAGCDKIDKSDPCAPSLYGRKVFLECLDSNTDPEWCNTKARQFCIKEFDAEKCYIWDFKCIREHEGN